MSVWKSLIQIYSKPHTNNTFNQKFTKKNWKKNKKAIWQISFEQKCSLGYKAKNSASVLATGRTVKRESISYQHSTDIFSMGLGKNVRKDWIIIVPGPATRCSYQKSTQLSAFLFISFKLFNKLSCLCRYRLFRAEIVPYCCIFLKFLSGTKS